MLSTESCLEYNAQLCVSLLARLVCAFGMLCVGTCCSWVPRIYEPVSNAELCCAFVCSWGVQSVVTYGNGSCSRKWLMILECCFVWSNIVMFMDTKIRLYFRLRVVSVLFSYRCIIGYSTLCFDVLQGDITTLAGVYTFAFLGVMTLFSVGTILLKFKRPSLPREVTVSYGTTLVGLFFVSILLK